MRVKGEDPRDVVVGLLNRSVCSVQVAALLVDNYGIHSWGWNSVGRDGLGWHAEAHCLVRSNRERLPLSTMYIASRRARNGKIVTSRPCLKCQPLLKSIGTIIYRDYDGRWVEFP